MKKIFSIIVTGFLIIGTLASCTQDEIIPESMLEETEACCGEGGIPPGGGGGNGGG